MNPEKLDLIGKKMYHGTTLEEWKQSEFESYLFVADSFDVAKKHAIDRAKSMAEYEKKPSTAIVVELTITKEMTHLRWEADDDLGNWNYKTWRDSYDAVGSFVICGLHDLSKYNVVFKEKFPLLTEQTDQIEIEQGKISDYNSNNLWKLFNVQILTPYNFSLILSYEERVYKPTIYSAKQNGELIGFIMVAKTSLRKEYENYKSFGTLSAGSEPSVDYLDDERDVVLMLAVDPNHRGKGIAQKLINAANLEKPFYVHLNSVFSPMDMWKRQGCNVIHPHDTTNSVGVCSGRIKQLAEQSSFSFGLLTEQQMKNRATPELLEKLKKFFIGRYFIYTTGGSINSNKNDIIVFEITDVNQDRELLFKGRISSLLEGDTLEKMRNRKDKALFAADNNVWEKRLPVMLSNFLQKYFSLNISADRVYFIVENVINEQEEFKGISPKIIAKIKEYFVGKYFRRKYDDDEDIIYRIKHIEFHRSKIAHSGVVCNVSGSFKTIPSGLPTNYNYLFVTDKVSVIAFEKMLENYFNIDVVVTMDFTDLGNNYIHG